MTILDQVIDKLNKAHEQNIPQIQLKLYDNQGGFCALGIATKWKEKIEEHWLIGVQFNCISCRVMPRYEHTISLPSVLVSLNDTKHFTFKQIADELTKFKENMTIYNYGVVR